MNNILITLTKEEKNKVEMVDLQKGQILFNEGQKCENVGVVINGEIEIVSYSYGGKEIIFSVLKESMMFGNNLIFSSNPYYKGSIIAKKATKLALFSKKQLLYLLKNNDGFLMYYLNYQSDLGKELNGQIKLLTLDSAEERFFYYLHSQQDKIYYQSVTELARRIYIQRETLSRLLTKLIKENKIIKEPHYIFKK